MKRKSAVALAIIALFAFTASAQSQKKQKNADTSALPSVESSVAQELDHDIGEMLGAWQVGDVDAMHKYYADNATWVSGAYAPPISGWENYVPAYEQQFKRMSSVQLIRRNSNFFHYNSTAWVCYQWELDAIVDGKPTTARGQTTLVLVKTGDRWLIVHNHTSEICPR
ncbi:MAG: nuclear transport factor 2 family protein [Candidatus Acidiferrales bacterium]